MTRIRECCLCSQIEGRKENDLIARMLPGEPYARRIMTESASFAVVPSLGPLAEGHCLLCPKAHIRSFASLDGSVHAEYQDVKARLKERLRGIYGAEVMLFEHGMAATSDRILCTVDHAHMHFVPLAVPLHPGALCEKGWIDFDGTLAELKRLSQGREYIFHETPDGAFRLLGCADQPLESQYMRRVVAESLGETVHWNWREAPDPIGADETWRRYVSFLPGAGA